MKFSISEKFTLKISWIKVVYEQEGFAKLEGCYLSGPVIKDVDQMNSNDFMDLDFGNQYLVFVGDYYIARFSWAGVRHVPEKIFLDNVTIKNRHVNSVPKLNDNDYIIVDTKNHVDDNHSRHLTYAAYLIRFDGDRYNFEEIGR